MDDPIKLGRALSLPKKAVTKKFAIMGMSESGKTYAAGKLVEEMLDLNAQVIVLDPVGVWWGLRLKASGKRRGFDIPVLGGVRGDLPLDHTAGRLLAETLAQGKHSCVVDVSLMSKSKMAHFVADFADAFLEAKKRNKSPVHLVFEEAQMFVPQFIRKGNANAARMLGHLEDLIKIGRNHGVGNTLISQRPQAVNWDVLSQAEVLMAFRMIGVHEKKTIRTWVVEKDGPPESLSQLPFLDTGECFFWSPVWVRLFLRTQIHKKKTYDASATPEDDEDFEETKLPKLDLESFGKKMAEFAEEAKENDVPLLKAEVKRLKAKVKEIEARAPQVRDVEVEVEVEVPVVDETTLGLLQQQLRHIESSAKESIGVIEDTRKEGRKIKARPKVAKAVMRRTTEVASSAPPPPPVPPTGKRVRGFLRVVQAVAALEPRLGPVPVPVICLYAGISKRSSTSSVYPNKAVQAGLLEKTNGTQYVLTNEGKKMFPVTTPPTAEALRNHWLNSGRVGGKRADILLYLCRRGSGVPTTELMEAVGISLSSSTASVYPNQLRQLGLIYKNGNSWCAMDDLIG
jgi:predicted transcriptional regulator